LLVLLMEETGVPRGNHRPIASFSGSCKLPELLKNLTQRGLNVQ